MQNVIIKQIAKVVRLRFPNAVFISVDCKNELLIVTEQDGNKSEHKATAEDSKYLPMFGEMYDFKETHTFDMNLTKPVKITVNGIGKDGKPKTLTF